RHAALPSSLPDVEEAVAELLEGAVGLRLRSDVPVGVCLSGGLDSTAIICDMARNRGVRDGGQAAPPLLAFCYHDAAFDERAFIADTLSQTGALLQRISLTPHAMWSSLAEVLRFQDEPIVSGAPIAGFHLMKLAASHGVKVVLNGQGPDEVFAGYSCYFHDHWYTLLRSARVTRAWHEMRAYAAERRANAGQLFLYELARLFHHQLRRLRPYRSVARTRRWRRLKERRWFTPPLIDRLDASDAGYEDPHLDAVLRRSVERTPLPHYLRLEDRNSMAHGVEARLPFMDYRLVSLAFRAGVDRKIEGVWNKALLRRSLRGRIPDSVRTRAEKMGFPTSLHVWLTSALVEPLRALQRRHHTMRPPGARRGAAAVARDRAVSRSARARRRRGGNARSRTRVRIALVSARVRVSGHRRDRRLHGHPRALAGAHRCASTDRLKRRHDRAAASASRAPRATGLRGARARAGVDDRDQQGADARGGAAPRAESPARGGRARRRRCNGRAERHRSPGCD